ncbi:unnamed protein product (mitochondrion) [Plasmodiophora brassicae]|uniref:Alginate lyase 2 domain-containing protein n=1 Tax=Plasmodiophora brassicae TaxID=37360 RepID=A0A0G4IHK8_PLABS|nr:hypothetical protein PBRA_000337 [Plasmodiophora brassicae]SPQ96897.1 unnamed protein product [Plasmodiophora brassicae]
MPTAATSTSDMPFLDPRSPPSGNFNLSQFTLQLAISPVQIGYSPIGWNDSDNFFTDPVDGAMSFSTPSDGNTTEGSHYPRTELRHKVEFWFDRRSTPMLSNRLEVTERVSALSHTGRMVIGQIHGYDDGSEAVKIYWYNDPKRGGVLYASVKENLGIVSPARGRYAAPFGQKYSYSIEVNANIVTCMLNGYTETYTMNASSWATHNVYFKAGNYLQDNSLPRTVGTVKIYFIKVQNNVNLGASLPPSNQHATVVGASDASHIENIALIVTGCAFTFFGMLACIAIVLQRRSASKRLIVTDRLITAIADVPVLAASSITRSVDIPDLGARVQHGHMRRMR